MNCAECRDQLIARVEEMLDPGQEMEFQQHLNNCSACQAEYSAVVSLQQRLVARGQLAAEVSITAPVMRRIRAVQTQPESSWIMSKLNNRWGFGLGAAAGLAAVILVLLLSMPGARVSAEEVMSRGAAAASKIRSIHLRGQVRTAPQDNFSAINLDNELAPIELWKQFEPDLKWRIDKPGRVAAMDGESTVLYVKPMNLAMKVQASPSAFDTQWLHEIANLSQTLENELRSVHEHGWPVTLSRERGTNGSSKFIVTVQAASGLADADYLKNQFFMTADTRRVYVFDDRTELLESVRFYAQSAAGERLVFELTEIEYDQEMNVELFNIQLPADVTWYQQPQQLPDNEKYAAMTPEQAVRAFFEACARADWNEVRKFYPGLTGPGQQYLGGLEIISLGEPFTSDANTASRFVPYEIRLPNGAIKKHNLALQKDAATGRWVVDGGI